MHTVASPLPILSFSWAPAVTSISTVAVTCLSAALVPTSRTSLLCRLLPNPTSVQCSPPSGPHQLSQPTSPWREAVAAGLSLQRLKDSSGQAWSWELVPKPLVSSDGVPGTLNLLSRVLSKLCSSLSTLPRCSEPSPCAHTYLQTYVQRDTQVPPPTQGSCTYYTHTHTNT